MWWLVYWEERRQIGNTVTCIFACSNENKQLYDLVWYKRAGLPLIVKAPPAIPLKTLMIYLQPQDKVIQWWMKRGSKEMTWIFCWLFLIYYQHYFFFFFGNLLKIALKKIKLGVILFFKMIKRSCALHPVKFWVRLNLWRRKKNDKAKSVAQKKKKKKGGSQTWCISNIFESVTCIFVKVTRHNIWREQTLY